MNDGTLAIVLGGGKGTRLIPLTKDRAKPAVPFGGKYRLVDIPISNCINSGIKKIYILTQFNSASLHNHISNTYIFDTFSQGFVSVLAAGQTPQNEDWYQGTADAVRKNIMHFHDQQPKYYIILSGDQLYRMDYREMLKTHRESNAELTIAVKPISRNEATGLGIVGTDKTGRIVSFLEKPPIDMDISDYKAPGSIFEANGIDAQLNFGKEYLASMGIYIFNAEAMEKALDNNRTDFGKEIIPETIHKVKVQTHIFNDFWEDIGTIKSFYDTNLNLASLTPDFNFYDELMPIYTHRRHLPATKVNFCTISQSLTSEGSIITNASIVNSIIGVRTLIESGANLDGVYCMGSNYYESDEEKLNNKKRGIPNIGIGRGTIIRKAIIDLNARIGDGCRIGIDTFDRVDGVYEFYHICDGIIVIPKNAIIPAGTVV
ncbi:MAG: glucose-1-phosphate adenylyltransferase [Spirochaetales bacterium]|nr:glucose-1-phosphate adenylyltransferase [Spirochaetales bacterium]